MGNKVGKGNEKDEEKRKGSTVEKKKIKGTEKRKNEGKEEKKKLVIKARSRKRESLTHRMDGNTQKFRS